MTHSLRHIALILCLCLTIPLLAWDYESTDSQTEQSVQLRVGAQAVKKWDNGIRLGVAEDLRFDLYNSIDGTAFNKSYTTLSMAYSPIKYLRLDAGYTLKLLGQKGFSDPNEFLRHRVYFGLVGTVKIGRSKLSLRERPMLEIRTDSVNLLEKNKIDWMLRSKVSYEYDIRSLPLKPYVWIEVVNTLNAPEYKQKYKDNDPQNGGHQYIRRIRTAVGVSYKLNRHNSLDFYYRFNYGYDRDINITRKKAYIELTEETSYQHVVGIAYNFGW